MCLHASAPSLVPSTGGGLGSGVTHRARYVCAARPLAVGATCRRASDLLLLAQQLAVLLLSVLHVDEQRDEAVLHLQKTKEHDTAAALTQSVTSKRKG